MERTGARSLREQAPEAVGAIAHDLGNLLTIILTAAELLAAGVVDDDTRSDVEKIRRAAEKAVSLIGRLTPPAETRRSLDGG